jgi:N-acetylneuraminate synthase/N,N'-diacetyllegionaminate synthase
MVDAISIGKRTIGPDSPCFVIAEAGVNHNGDLDRAKRLVDAAVAARADAVKFQIFKAEQVVSRTASKARYQQDKANPQESQLEMLARLELSPQAHRELQRYCTERDILFMSTPFDESSADFLEELDVPIFKVGSGELTNLPFLKYLALKDKPIILSTGMAYLGEVEEAVNYIRRHRNVPLALLHCVSDYPARQEDVNLRAMQTLQQAFGLLVGYSDHTLGLTAALAAVALGAQIIEKHFTLSHTLPGPDHQASLEPNDLMLLVEGIRSVEAALGDGIKRPTSRELHIAQVARKSLISRCDIKVGTPITADMLDIKRPGTGISPRDLDRVVGRITREDIPKDTPLTWEML